MSAKPKTGLVIVTHGQTGQAMIDVAEFILDQFLAELGFVSFRQSAGEKTGNDEIQKAIRLAEQGQGVLVLTDLGGASPSNQVSRMVSACNAMAVCGLNLAMLIRVWNYRDRSVRELADLAIEGGIRDIRECGK